MTRDCNPPLLLPLLPAPGGPPSSAAEVVERMRLWDPAGPSRERGSAAGPSRHGGAAGPSRRRGGAPGRPRVFLNMASTADGRATLAGRSGGIGNRADHQLFRALRTSVDAVIVGASTARAEHYRGIVRDPILRRLRRARGLQEEPLACIVSASLSLSPSDVPLLADPSARVLVLTPSPSGVLACAGGPDGGRAGGDEAGGGQAGGGQAGGGQASEGQARGGQASEGDTCPARPQPVAYIRAARAGALDLAAALGELYARWGVRTLLCEGGPHLNGQLLRAGLVDELFLSFAPRLAGGSEAALRIVCGPELDPPAGLELLAAHESEGLLLLRYRVSP